MAEMRPAIIKLHEKGFSTRKIGELLDVPQRKSWTILSVTKKPEATKTEKDGAEKRRHETAETSSEAKE
jgi:hypothetical protein